MMSSGRSILASSLLLKFRMWFKYGLKAQKLQKQHALKGQKLLAQGIALGAYGRKPVAL
ncbi:hypothetical protein V7T00_12185 [Segatella copri]